MNNISSTIKRLIKVINDPNCSRMNLSSAKGYLGELLIKNKLENEGLEVEHHGNQSGYDLSYKYNGNEFRVDVKTSLLKNEYGFDYDYWNWALLHENKKKKIKATHILCLGCDKDFSPHIFIVIPIDKMSKFPSGMKQFSKVKHALMVSRGNNKTQEDEFNKQCRALLDRNKIDVIKFNRPLKNKLKP